MGRRTKAQDQARKDAGIRSRHQSRLRAWEESGRIGFPPLPTRPYSELGFVLRSHGLPEEWARMPEDKEELRRWKNRLRYRWLQTQNGVIAKKPPVERLDPILIHLRARLMRKIGRTT